MALVRGKFAAGLAVGAVILLAALGLSSSLAASKGPGARTAVKCGEERWPVKTLSDSKVGDVKFTPHDTSIGRLRNKPDPHTKPSTPRLDGVETTTYQVKARLIEFKREDDHDIHLVIGVPSAPAKTMIVEFPDTTCNGASSHRRKLRWAPLGRL